MEHQIKEFDSLIDLLEDLDREGITGVRKKEIVDTFLTFKARVKKQPYNGGFELTPFCNFDCKMCYVHLKQNQIEEGQRLLTVSEWISIMQQAIDAGMLNADLTGGECLTYPGFKEVYLFLLSKGIQVNILTNGYLIDDEMVEFLSTYRPKSVQVSVYGSNDEKYLLITGKKAFQQVIDAVERLKKANISVSLAITPHRYMKDDAADLIRIVRSLDVNYSVSSVTLPARPDTGRLMEDYIAEAELFDEIKADDEKYFSEKLADLPPSFKAYGFTVKGLKKEAGLQCGSGRCGFHVNWKGEMMPCIPFYGARKSVLKLGFEEAWKQMQIAAASYKEPEECSLCQIRDFCMACPAEKTFGMLNGQLNTSVCEKMKLKHNRMNGRRDKHEEGICATKDQNG